MKGHAIEAPPMFRAASGKRDKLRAFRRVSEA
jgi:hypothetical protein